MFKLNINDLPVRILINNKEDYNIVIKELERNNISDIVYYRNEIKIIIINNTNCVTYCTSICDEKTCGEFKTCKVKDFKLLKINNINSKYIILDLE